MGRPKKRKTLRDDLCEARDRVRRQLQILKGMPSTGDLWGDNRSVIAKLETELSELNEALADLDRPDG